MTTFTSGTVITSEWLNTTDIAINRETVDVLSYGADPTGVVTSTADFNEANATGKQVIIPPGIWKLDTDTNIGTWKVLPGATFTGTGILRGNTIHETSSGTNFIQRLISTYETFNQLIGLQVEQGLWQTGTNSAFQFGQTTELYTPTASTTTWTGQHVATYGAYCHFGSGSLDTGAGGAFEGFNPGSGTATLIIGVNGNAWNGGVAAGIPWQYPTNNGNALNLRAVSGFATNASSGTVTNASTFYANATTNTGGGSITNVYGMLIGDQTAGVTNYSIFTGIGKIHFGDAVNFAGRSNLPAATGGTDKLWIASGTSSPTNGRIYVGDGSGWQVEFCSRTGSADTVLGSFADSGTFTAKSLRGTSATTAIGYSAGSGGTVTQATSKSTTVTLNATTGKITMHSAALAANTTATFTFQNSAISSTSIIVCSAVSGTTNAAYIITAENIQAGVCSISLYNHSAGSLAEAVAFNFAILNASLT